MRLKHSQVETTRNTRWLKNGKKCELCGQPVSQTAVVLDHCHKHGWVRGSICRGCNSLLGKVENNAPRYGVRNLTAFLFGAATYLQRNSVFHSGLYHPLHKTEDEKRLARNAKARTVRAKKKAVPSK